VVFVTLEPTGSMGVKPIRSKGNKMQRYFFDLVENGHSDYDVFGTPLDNLAAAHAEAVEALLEIAVEVLPKDGPRTLMMVVRDESGSVLKTVRLAFDPG